MPQTDRSRKVTRTSSSKRPPYANHHDDGDSPNESGLVRLQRVMAAAGVASRRDCEVLIEEGHVTVNSKVVRKLPVLIDPDVDQVHVDGRPLRKPERRIYIMVNKPARVLCTTRDDPAFLDAKGQGRPTILDLVSHPAKPRLFPVGRLDYHTTGLVLLTNDGELANKLTHPSHGVPRTYEALVRRSANETDLNELARESVRPERGARGRESRAKAVQLSFVKHDSDRTLIRVSLTEGPNRSVPDVLARLGFHVKRLERVAIGPLELSGIPVGGWRELTRSELTLLKKDPSSSPKYRERTMRPFRENASAEGGASETPSEHGERGTSRSQGNRQVGSGERPVRKTRNTPPPAPNSRAGKRSGPGRRPGAGAGPRTEGGDLRTPAPSRSQRGGHGTPAPQRNAGGTPAPRRRTKA